MCKLIHMEFYLVYSRLLWYTRVALLSSMELNLMRQRLHNWRELVSYITEINIFSLLHNVNRSVNKVEMLTPSI